eukprot:RCo054405
MQVHDAPTFVLSMIKSQSVVEQNRGAVLTKALARASSQNKGTTRIRENETQKTMEVENNQAKIRTAGFSDRQRIPGNVYIGVTKQEQLKRIGGFNDLTTRG